MGQIVWNESLNFNIKEIDMQHMRFLEIVNDLLKAMEEKRAHALQSKIIDELLGYAFYHFTKEERYFQNTNYPGAKLHIKEHEGFVDKIIQFKEDFENKKITLSIDMINFMINWWITHIKVNDRQYLPYVKASLEKGNL